MLEAAFQPPATGKNRTFIVHFTLPGAIAPHKVNWTLGLYRADGSLLRQWRGRHVLQGGSGQAVVHWHAPPALSAGIYQLRLQAGNILQHRPVAVGKPLPLLPASAALDGAGMAAPARIDGLGFDIVYGNLHSQTNHSDGGGDPASCRGAQAPRSGAFGPDDAYRFAQQHGLQFLLVSEHNHMYDASDGSDPHADPLAARQLYRLGIASAEQYSTGHPGFVAMYGLEWGVISGGGHLNILNSPALLGWERSANGEPFADVVTPKNNYAALYAVMKEQGWLGQFNHPGARQFPIDGVPLAFSEDGGAAMALCEVMNSNAFSKRLDEGETRHSFYEEACDKLLEAGYRLAFSSNQDNHCANWGAAYSNRTGILLPAAAAPTAEALLDAIRARHVFATMDKQSAIALTANGTMMGARIDNSGPLTLQVHYTSSTGRGIAALDIMEGVPGRHGEVKPVRGVNGMQHSFTPQPGAHFYYARLTQDDGKQLWSAPVWVNQR
ncbi:phosphotransferase [Duganella sp. Root198D2]|nr:phosphotransferase [Duganella sp. Root336D2]KRB84421.1 phosphotransferase [Duganella sp. Root198D2]